VLTDPHAWHTYLVFAFAMGGTIHEHRCCERGVWKLLPQMLAATTATA